MKSEEEIRDKLAVLRDERTLWDKGPRSTLYDVVKALKDERINALEWVLGENNQW